MPPPSIDCEREKNVWRSNVYVSMAGKEGGKDTAAP